MWQCSSEYSNVHQYLLLCIVCTCVVHCVNNLGSGFCISCNIGQVHCTCTTLRTMTLSSSLLPPSLPPSRFVPSDWVNKQELVLDEVNDLNKLNMEFCQHMTALLPIFTPFQHGNFTCILIKEVQLCMLWIIC